MAKCKKEYIEGAIVKLISQISSTMPNSMYKFLIGGAATFASLKSAQQIEEILKYVSDENGLVDLDLLKKMIDGAFNASGGKITIDLFNNQSVMSLFVKPISLTISKGDIDQLIKELDQNCVSTDVSLSQNTTTAIIENK